MYDLFRLLTDIMLIMLQHMNTYILVDNKHTTDELIFQGGPSYKSVRKIRKS